jgi:hypothetical protein
MSRALCIIVFLAALLQCTAIASAQQSQQNAAGSAASSNTASSALSNAINPSVSRTILLPNGARRTASPSTDILCDFDDLAGTYLDSADVCALGR